MDILTLIDRMEEVIDHGRNVPLASGRIVDTDKLYELIDEVRAQYPDELKQARWIVKERQEMLAEAKTESERLVDEANEKAARLASEEDVVRLAEKQAKVMMMMSSKAATATTRCTMRAPSVAAFSGVAFPCCAWRSFSP